MAKAKFQEFFHSAVSSEDFSYVEPASLRFKRLIEESRRGNGVNHHSSKEDDVIEYALPSYR